MEKWPFLDQNHGLTPFQKFLQLFFFRQYRPGKCLSWYSRAKERLSRLQKGNTFYDFLRQKNAFLGYKNKMLKKSKNGHFYKGVNSWLWSKIGRFSNLFLGNIGQENDIFPKGLAHGFVPKMAILPPFFFRQYRAGKCFWWYSRNKKRLSRLKKQEVQTVEISHFSKGVNPLIWSNNDHFSKFFFLWI